MGVGRRPTAASPTAPRCSRGCGRTSPPWSAATRDRIRGWDVVNEALNDDGTLRDSPWRRGIGDDYIARRSSSRSEADPDAELYYNDYNLATRPGKRAGAIRIIKDLQQRGLRIDAVGEQGHWRLDSPTAAEIDQTITELRATGVKVMITELDVNLLPPAGGRRAGSRRRPTSNPYRRTACRTTCSRRSRATTPTPSACC